MQHNDDPRNIFFNQRMEYRKETQKQEKTTEQGNTTQQEKTTQQSKTTSNDYDAKVAEMKKLAEKYQREGEGQLVKDIVNSVIEQKAAGKLSNEQLVAFAKRVSPLLNAEQKLRLNGLLEQLLQL